MFYYIGKYEVTQGQWDRVFSTNPSFNYAGFIFDEVGEDGVLTTNLGTAGASWPWDVLVLTGFFTALWIVSARLFRKAARHPLSDPEFK